MNLISERIIGFDALRAVMVILLFVVHSGVSFMHTNLEGQWFYQDNSTSIFFDGMVSFLHAFRLPIFFLLAGFLNVKTIYSENFKDYFSKKTKRILIPFLIVLLSITPLVNSLFALLNHQSSIFSLNILFPISPDNPIGLTTGYVWFLYYLFLFMIIHYLLSKLNLKNLSRLNLGLFFQLFLLLIIVSSLLYFQRENTLSGEYNFIPSFFSFTAYFSFYFLGVSFGKNAESLKKIAKWTWLFFFLGFISVSLFIGIGYLKIIHSENVLSFDIRSMITSVFTSILFTLGSIGFAIRYYTKPLTFINYVSKSSYFIYLIHFPIVLLSLKLVSNLNYGALIKFSLVFIGSFFAAMALNHLWRTAWRNNPPI